MNYASQRGVINDSCQFQKMLLYFAVQCAALRCNNKLRCLVVSGWNRQLRHKGSSGEWMEHQQIKRLCDPVAGEWINKQLRLMRSNGRRVNQTRHANQLQASESNKQIKTCDPVAGEWIKQDMRTSGRRVNQTRHANQLQASESNKTCEPVAGEWIEQVKTCEPVTGEWIEQVKTCEPVTGEWIEQVKTCEPVAGEWIEQTN